MHENLIATSHVSYCSLCWKKGIVATKTKCMAFETNKRKCFEKTKETSPEQFCDETELWSKELQTVWNSFGKETCKTQVNILCNELLNLEMASVIDDAQKRIRETFVNVPKLPNINKNINWLANARLLVSLQSFSNIKGTKISVWHRLKSYKCWIWLQFIIIGWRYFSKASCSG